MRWIAKAVWVAFFITLAGCTQQCFISEPDYEHYVKMGSALLERNPHAGQPSPLEVQSELPSTILDPEKREPWYLSLSEAVAISLENGTVGIQNVINPGNIPNDLIFSGPGQLQGIQFATDSIRVLAMTPAISGASIEASLARFDPKWVTQMLWSKTDQQVQGLGSFQNGDRGRFESSLTKPLPTGGLANITFSTDYTFLDDPPGFFPIQNPAYLARWDINFEQPLWQNFGVNINQLRSTHPGANPGSNLTGPALQFLGAHPGAVTQGLSAGFGTEGILIARLRFDQSRSEFERLVNYQLLNVEAAYWNLYAAYVDLYAAEQGLRQAHAVWTRMKALREAGGGKDFKVYFEDRARGQYHLFSGDRTQALGRVLDAERILRALMGLKADDGKQLIPIDAPTLAPYHPDWFSAVEETMHLRPELIAIREELKIRQLDLELQKNFLKPDLRFVSRYGNSGLGSRLDGNGSVFDASTQQFRPNNALRNLSSTHFHDWNLGLTLNVPLGYRIEHASVRRARLAFAQAFMALKNEERKAESFLVKAFRDIFEYYKQVQDRRAQRESFGKALENFLILVEGEQQVIGSEELFQAQRDYVNALRQEALAIAAYNSALASFQFAKGTLLRHNNIVINEGPLPECAQVRAVENERKRSKALLIRERSLAVPHGPLAMPDLPAHVAPSVPALMTGAAATVPDLPAPIGAVPTETKEGFPALPQIPTSKTWTNTDEVKGLPILPNSGAKIPSSPEPAQAASPAADPILEFLSPPSTFAASSAVEQAVPLPTSRTNSPSATAITPSPSPWPQ